MYCLKNKRHFMIRWVFNFAAKSVGMHKGRDGDRCEGGG